MKYVMLLLLLATNVNSFADGFKKAKKDTTGNTFNKDYVLHIKKAHSPIKIDGVIDEPDWLKAEKATDFHAVLPIDTGLAIQQSEVVMTYDDKAFYLAFTFYDTIPGKRIMESFRRDFTFYNNDNFLAFFDTFLDQTTGFTSQPFENTKLWLVGPKLDVTFTDKIFWSTFVQHNEQIDNMNINMRFQWRYQPVSDLFIVYTDNYIPGTWNSRNRALVLKLTYWLN